MAFFTKAPRAGFRVFYESGIVRPFKKQQPLEFCKRCNGHHPSRNCSRAPSCANCGSKNHSVDTCMAATKCRNCGGPHLADSRRFLARPDHAGVPTKDQMKTYHQAVQRARVVEEKAATLKILKRPLSKIRQLSQIAHEGQPTGLLPSPRRS